MHVIQSIEILTRITNKSAPRRRWDQFGKEKQFELIPCLEYTIRRTKILKFQGGWAEGILFAQSYSKLKSKVRS